MDSFTVLRSILLICLLSLIDIVEKTAAVYCEYTVDTGRVEFTYCPEQCCAGQITHKYDACCEFTHSNGVYIGASLGTMILVGVIFLCLTYLCCKQRMMQRARENSRGSLNTRTGQHRNRSRSRRHSEPSIPSVSISVEPIQPPSYDSLDFPPPYFPDAGTSDSKQEDKSYLDNPPPAYTQHVEDDK